jgi:hypothetical protein
MADARNDRSARLLLACMDPTGRAWEEAIEGSMEEIDWPRVLQRARAHKLIGILASRMKDSSIGSRVPEAVEEELKGERTRGREHQGRVARTLEETRNLLTSLGCPFLVIKGSVYAHDLYEEPSMRRFSDVDILIPHAKLDAVDQGLKEAGYYFWNDPNYHRGRSRWSRRRAPEGEEAGSEASAKRILAAFHRHHLYVLPREDPRMHVEVHWHVFVPGQGRVSPEDLWSETRSTILEGVETRTLGWEASLLHAAAHCMEHPPTGCRLLHLSDVAWMMVKRANDLDAERLRRLAQDWRLGRFLTSAVTALERTLPLGLPESSRRLWPRKSLVGDCFLSAAGFGPWIADQALPASRATRLAERVWREGLWELALGRLPSTAWGHLSGAVRARIPKRGQGVRGPSSSDGARP